LPACHYAFTNSPLPSVIVVDSSFIFEALIDSGQGGYEATHDFAERLRTANTRRVFSGLLFMEAPQCWKRLGRKGVLVPSQRSTDPVTDRLNAFAQADQSLQTFLAAFNTSQMRVSPRIIGTASSLVATYKLQSHDAVVAAVAQEVGIRDIAATDHGFRRIEDIELWDGRLP
jgi:predicted nucleic acid-binding protein